MTKFFQLALRKIHNYSEFIVANESLKSWLSTFLLLASLGLVPAEVRSADSETKRKFVESQPTTSIDAAKFAQYLTNFGGNRALDLVWGEFVKSDSTVKSAKDEVIPMINQNGKKYSVGSGYEVHDYSDVDIAKFTPDNWMTDMGSMISDSQEPAINNWIADYERKTSIEIGIITVKNLGDNDIETYANDQFNRLGVGKKGADNGILVVFSLENRKSRIETGRGMEEYLTDLQCHRILDQIKPYFRKEDYYGGTMLVLEAIKKELGEDSFEKKVEWDRSRKEQADRESAAFWADFADWAVIILIMGALIGSGLYVRHRINRRKKALEEIINVLGRIEELRGSIPESADLKSPTLVAALQKLKSTIENIDTAEIKKANKDREDYLDGLEECRDLIVRSISAYNQVRTGLLSVVSDVRGLDQFTRSAYSQLDSAIAAYQEVQRNGYNVSAPSARTAIESAMSLANSAKAKISTNIDEAARDLAAFKQRIQSILRTGEASTSTLNAINLAKRNVQNRTNLIETALSAMMVYHSWAHRGEKESIDAKVSGMPSLSGMDILKASEVLMALISEINAMKSRWLGRKNAYEEEQRRRAAAAAAAAAAVAAAEAAERRRSEESSSSSSFSGFGGGSSGGGGSSSDW